MSISFKGAKKYKLHNGIKKKNEVYSVLPSPIYVYPLFFGDIKLNPTVSIGDEVLIGTKLADLESYETIPCHSSVSGIVKDITDTDIYVENDMNYTSISYNSEIDIANSLTTREALWLIREAGICEIRNGKPVHVLLGTDTTPDYVIVPCFDSDPYISSPQIYASKKINKILKSLNIVCELINTEKKIIAVTEDCKQTYYGFKQKLRFDESTELYLLKNRYPQSRDNILVKTLTGKTKDKINALILSPETLCNIYDALMLGKPVTEKLVTVSGDDILPAHCYRVPIGLPISSLLHDCGYTLPTDVFINGIIDGEKITDLDIPVKRDTMAVTAFCDSKNIPRYAKK